MEKWSELPGDLLREIAEDSSFYLFRLRCVCSPWRSAVKPKRRLLPGRLPDLPDDNTDISTTPTVFQLSGRTIFLIKPPESRRQTVPTNTSWLIKVEEDALTGKRLINPLKRQSFDFRKVLAIQNLNICEIGQEFVLKYGNGSPTSSSMNESSNLYKKKVVLMHLHNRESNYSEDFVMLTVHVSGKLAIFKGGHQEWKILQQDRESSFDDVIVYKGRLYAVDNRGSTFVVDSSFSSVSLVAKSAGGGYKKYLVECKGDLLLVDMHPSRHAASFHRVLGWERQLPYFWGERTAMFKVSKLDEKRKEWVEVQDLKDAVLFLGQDCAFSASVDNLCVSEGNCIVFVDNDCELSENGEYDDGRSGVSVFYLDSRCAKPLGAHLELSKLFWTPPAWMTPSISDVPNHA